MHQYVLLKKINVQNANAIAGLTYGFPAITNFLGFVHALSRKLPSCLGITLGGVAVVSHKNDVHARQPKGWGDYVFALTRNPLTHQGKTAPINEEGRMNMQVSLLIEVEGLIAGDSATEIALREKIFDLMPTMRIAGGQIISFEFCEILNDEASQKRALRRLMPGFVLLDRSDYLEEHFERMKKEQPEASLFDAWCDFTKLKYQATRIESERSEQDQDQEGHVMSKASWDYIAKPNAGYLVPIASGYYAISSLYSPGEVSNVRDNSVPVVFAETAYSVGLWQSVHRLKDINDSIWRYTYEFPWYIAKSQTSTPMILMPDVDVETSEAAFDPDYI